MRYRFQKKLWWSLLVVGIGGMLLFALIFAIETRRFYAADYGILMSGFFLMCLSTTRLITCYRAEPAESDTHWQLSIRDLLALTFLEGLILSIFSSMAPKHFFNLGIPFALATAIFSVVGALVASRKGIDPSSRSVYACGFGLMVIGGLLTGALTILTAVLFMTEHINPFDPIRDIIVDSRPEPYEWVTVMFRTGLIYLVFGMLACTLASKRSNPDQNS